MKRYDIFISYRREDGSVAARSLYDRLKRDGYNVFLDVASMTRCEFDKQIKGTIEACKDFILILSKKALNETTNQDDWVREELAYAIEKGKNIIPVFLPDFEKFPQNLPSNISAIRTINGLTYNHTYFASYYNSLKDDFLISKPKSHRLIIGSIVIILILLIVLAFFQLSTTNRIPLTSDVSIFKKEIDVRLARMPTQDVIHFVKVNGGVFHMGKNRDSSGLRTDESPMHLVRLDTFWIMDTEITNGVWRLLKGELDPKRKDANYPKAGVDYNDCKDIIDLLNEQIQDKRIKSMGLVFRLPTEAEWEYAARGGEHHDGFIYSGSDTLSDVTSVDNIGGMIKNQVKSCAPNSLGIYDMSGNLQEWCFDIYGREYYYDCKRRFYIYENPVGALNGDSVIVRGGSYMSPKISNCEVLNRHALKPTRWWCKSAYDDCGLRLVLGKPLTPNR